MRTLPLDGQSLLERVEALVPALAAEAPEAERLRRPTDAAIRMLEDAGLFRMMVPHAYGGLQLDLDTFLEVGLALGEADTSLAWVASFCVEHNWMLCQFPERFQRELYTGKSHILAPGVIAPTGAAVREAGGYRLTGRWQWGTGVMHASWVIVGALADLQPGEPPSPERMRFFAVPIADVKVEDTWYVDGMVGTGSNDIVIDGVLVPEERSVSIAAMMEGRAPGSRLHAAPLYHTPMLPILVLASATPVIGQTRAIVRGFGERLANHVRLSAAMTRQSEKPALQMRLGKAAIEARQAELALRDIVDEVCAVRDRATPVQRSRWVATGAHAVQQARRVLADVSEGSGASAHFLQHALQRAVRDANVASCHIVFDFDTHRQVYGKLLLGLDATGAMY